VGNRAGCYLACRARLQAGRVSPKLAVPPESGLAMAYAISQNTTPWSFVDGITLVHFRYVFTRDGQQHAFQVGQILCLCNVGARAGNPCEQPQGQQKAVDAQEISPPLPQGVLIDVA
jgi:hypothetical protein